MVDGIGHDGHDEFLHPALLYRSAGEYVARLVPFVRAGLAKGEPVAVAAPGPNIDLLKAGLGADAAAVRWWDMRHAGRNPGRILRGVLRAFADAHGDRRVRIVGEPVWPERTDLEYPACLEHEALINPAFAGRTVTIVCPYDAARLPARVLSDARLTHPVLWDADGDRASDRFAWRTAVQLANQALPAPDAPMSLHIDKPRLRATRSFVAERARRAGLDARRVEDVVLAANELASNTVEHAGGSGLLQIWTEPDSLVCEISDAGVLADRLAGRGPSPNPELGGYGLALVHEVADLVRIHTTSVGTTIRVYFRR